MSDNNNDRSNHEPGKRKSKKKRLLLKLFLGLLVICISAIASLPLIFSEAIVIDTIETAFTESTGLKLEIPSLDLKLFSGNILVHDVTAKTASNTVIASIDSAQLNLSLSDIYNLYKYDRIHIEDLQITNLHLNNVPYLDIVKEIAPETLNESYNLEIEKFLSTNAISISNLYLKQELDNKISYTISGKMAGKYSGGGEIKGNILGLETANLRKIELSGQTTGFNFNITNNAKTVNNSFSGSFKLQEFICDFNGTLDSQLTPLKIFNAIPETKYSGSGSWNLRDKIITLPEVVITNTDGLLINASGYIKNPTNAGEVVISADINNSLAQLNEIALSKDTIALSLNNGFTFTGKVFIAPNKLDIKGQANAEDITISRDNTQQVKSKVSTFFSATLDSLLFENIETNFGKTNINGSIYIPTSLFKKKDPSLYDLTNLELNLNLNGEMKEIAHTLFTLGQYPVNAPIPQGEINCKIITSQLNNTTNTFNLSIGSKDKGSTIYKSRYEKLPLGRFTGNLQGSITNNGQFNIDQLLFKSKPLELKAKAKSTDITDITDITYTLNCNTASFYPILPQKLNTAINAIDNLQAKGKGLYNLANNTFKSTNSTTELRLVSSNTPSHITLEGPFILSTTKQWSLSLPKTKINIINSDIINNKQSIGCTAILKSDLTLLKQVSKNEYTFSPKGVATIGARSKKSALINLIQRLVENDSKPFSFGSSTLRAKLDFNNDKIDCTVQLVAKDFVVKKPVYFSDTSLLSNSSFSYNIPDNMITINELKIDNEQKDYLLTATGNIYIENAIFQGFNSKFTADLDPFFKHFKGYGEDYNYTGNIEVYSELTGTSNSPSLTLVGKSKKMTLTKGGFSNITLEPKFDAQLSWDRDSEGNIFGLRAEEIFIKSSGGAVYFTGIAERFKLEEGGVVDFGKGCNIDIAVKGKRHLLWTLLPQYNHTSHDQGDNDSVNFTANLKAPKMPLFSFEKDLRRSYTNKIEISNGKFSIDQINQSGIIIKDITGNVSLKDGIGRLTNGKARLSGDVKFSSTTDLSNIPSGTITLTLSKIDLANALSRSIKDSPVLNGWLNIPSLAPSASLNLQWRGRTKKEILSSLKTKREKASIKDLVIESVTEKQDWEKYLAVDLTPSVAREVAKSIDHKLAATYGKKKKSYYKYFDLDYSIGNGLLNIHKLSCGGGNTADMIAKGVISLKNKLKLRIYIVDNIKKSFDIRKLVNIPTIQNLVANRTPEEKNKFYNILPSTLDRLAKEKKLFIDVSGTIDKPEINIEGLRQEIRKNLPSIINQANSIIGQNTILQLLFRDVKSKKLKNALGAGDQKSSLMSGSSIGDLLQLIE